MESYFSKNLNSYFPEVEFGDRDLGLKQCLYVYISIFDHWLSEVEADECNVLCYDTALRAGHLNEYSVGESKFLKLYESLAQNGVICNRPAPLRVIEYGDLILEELFVASLREKKFMDIYFLRDQIRVIGRYDRTDLVILDRKADFLEFELKVKSAGLFVLHEGSKGKLG